MTSATNTPAPQEPLVIVVPDDDPPWMVGASALQRLDSVGQVVLYPQRAASPEELIQRMLPADVVINIRAYSKFTAEVLAQLPRLRFISVSGTGIDNLDLAAATARGIVISNTPGANAEAVAEHTLALILATARRIPWAHQAMKRGEWTRSMAIQLKGKTLGIIGTGRIGSSVARLGRAFGMDVIAWTPHPKEELARELGLTYVDLESLLARADVISLHLTLADGTRGLIGAREFGLMQSTALFINTARAALVDQEALLAALREGKIAGAALDVYHQEPIMPGDPLLALENVVFTPHSAGMTAESIINGQDMVVDNILLFLSGQPQYVVNPAVLHSP